MSVSQAMEPEYVTTDDGWSLGVRCFEPAETGNTAEAPALILLPAMGAHGGIYLRMAAHLAGKGHPVAVTDPRGVGISEPAPKRGIDYGVSEHAERDIPAVLDWIRARHPGRRVVLGGHSLGGHLSAIYAARNAGSVDGLVFLTVSHVHYRNFSPLSLLVFAGFSGLSRLMGYLPGHRIGWGSPIARQVVLDWAGWGISGRWRDSRGEDMIPLFADLDLPLLSISFADDLRLSPKIAVDRFAELFPAADVHRWHLSPEELDVAKAGHFDHLRGCPVLWDRISNWLCTVPGAQPATD